MSESSAPKPGASSTAGAGPAEPEPVPYRPAVQVGLIGDFDPGNAAHRAVVEALRLAGEQSGIEVSADWVGTEDIHSAQQVKLFDGLWCVPGSPYHSMDGALIAIRHAREHGVPFLGTCGGFQHAVLEYARNVLGWREAAHAETAPQARLPVISPLACGMIGQQGEVALASGSHLAQAYGQSAITGTYHCRYGINPKLQRQLTAGPLHATGHDVAGEIRAVEMLVHPFFVATLFQPERSALEGQCSAPVLAFVRACAA